MKNHTDLDYLYRVARAYDLAPVETPEASLAWQALSDETSEAYGRIERALDIERTTESEPYPSAYEMLVDIARGRLIVSVANSEHPIWTIEENIRFRVVHDVIGHGTTGAGFDWEGEWRAYEKHRAAVRSPIARHALFTEAVGQVAWRFAHGHFGAQKCAILPQYLQWER